MKSPCLFVQKAIRSKRGLKIRFLVEDFPDAKANAGSERVGGSDGKVRENLVSSAGLSNDVRGRFSHGVEHGNASIFKHLIVLVGKVIVGVKGRQKAQSDLSRGRTERLRRPQMVCAEENERDGVDFAVESEVEGALLEFSQLTVF